MKSYGYNSATEFTAKQIGVIYGMAKRQELKVEKWVVSEFYDLANFYGRDDNKNIERAEAKILTILDKVFAGDKEEAQRLIDLYTEQEFALYGRKAQAKLDRTLVA